MTAKQSKKNDGEQVEVETLSAPDEFTEQMKQVESYIRQNELSQAQACLSALLTQHGENRQLLLRVPLVKICLKDFDGAYQATLALTEEERNTQHIQNIIQGSIVLVKFKAYSSQAERDVLYLLEENLITEDEFYRVAQQLLVLKLGIAQQQLEVDLEKLKAEPLLLALLERSNIRSSVLAQTVLNIRNKLLSLSLTAMELPDRFVGLAQALAAQTMHNDFRQNESEPETAMITELQVMLDQVIDHETWRPIQLEGLFLLLCMYRRLSDLPIKDQLLALPEEAWPESLRHIVSLNLYSPAE